MFQPPQNLMGCQTPVLRSDLAGSSIAGMFPQSICKLAEGWTPVAKAVWDTLFYHVFCGYFMRMWVVNGLCVLFQRCCLSTNPYSSNPYSLNLQKPEESVHWLTAIRWMHRKNQGANSDFVIFWIEHFFSLRWDFHGHLKTVLRERKNHNASEDVNARSNKAFVVSHISPLKSLCWSENVLSRKR